MKRLLVIALFLNAALFAGRIVQEFGARSAAPGGGGAYSTADSEKSVPDDLRAGDYQRASSESTHVQQSTTNGCVLLLVSSQDDELV